MSDPEVSADEPAALDLRSPPANPDDTEPCVLDCILAEAMGLARPLTIRAAIEKNREELEGFGAVQGLRELVARPQGGTVSASACFLALIDVDLPKVRGSLGPVIRHSRPHCPPSERRCPHQRQRMRCSSYLLEHAAWRGAWHTSCNWGASIVGQTRTPPPCVAPRLSS